MSPQKGTMLKGNVIFQPSIFRGYVSFQRCILLLHQKMILTCTYVSFKFLLANDLFNMTYSKKVSSQQKIQRFSTTKLVSPTFLVAIQKIYEIHPPTKYTKKWRSPERVPFPKGKFVFQSQHLLGMLVSRSCGPTLSSTSPSLYVTNSKHHVLGCPVGSY